MKALAESTKKDDRPPVRDVEGSQGRPQGVHLDPWRPSTSHRIELGTKRNEVQWSFVP